MTRFHHGLAALAGLLLLAPAAGAITTSAEASAFGIEIGISSVVLNETVGPEPTAAAVGPPGGSDSNLLVDLSGISPLINSGTASVNASTNVNGGAGSRNAAADAIIEDADVGLSISIVLDDLDLTVTADEIFSSADVTGDFGSLVPTGDATLTNTFITLNGTTFGVDSEDFDDPNEEFMPGTFNPLGIQIILNEQIFGGDGVNSQSITVNALHIIFDPLAGLLAGDIILSQSHAAITAVPEPGTAALLGLGLMALGARGRKRF